MICFNDFLNTNVGSCADLAGARARAYLMPRSNINFNAFSAESVISFTTKTFTEVVPCYIDMDAPYKLAAESTQNDYGLTKHNKTVEIFINENTPLTQKQILQLQNESWVLILFDNNAQKIIVGYERGLRFVSSSQEFSSTETHGGVVVTMTETAANIPMVFVDYMDIEPATGLEITDTVVSLILGNTEDIAFLVLPAYQASLADIVISVLRPEIASAEQIGTTDVRIEGLDIGQTIVKVFSKDGNYMKTITVTVTPE